MTITNQSIIKRIAVDILVDPTSVRWPISELARYFNTVKRNIVLHRPDALPTTAPIALVAGTKQSVPATATKLGKIIRNSAGGKEAVTLSPWGLLDETIPGWHGLTGVTKIVHYMYDPERDTHTFYVYPPAASSGASVEAEYFLLPTDISEPADGGTFADITGNLDLPDIFESPMLNGIAALCYMKDSDTASNSQRASVFANAYGGDLGMEFKATQLVAPVTASSLRPRAAQ